jgi:hypothetical protein
MTTPEGTPGGSTPVDDGKHHISHEDAKDSLKYRHAKLAAANAGKPLVIDPRVDTPVTHRTGTIMIPRNTTPAEYRRLKADAERLHLPYAIEEAS